MTTMIEHSESCVGKIWTSEDHAKLAAHLRQIEELAQAAFDHRTQRLQTEDLEAIWGRS